MAENLVFECDQDHDQFVFEYQENSGNSKTREGFREEGDELTVTSATARSFSKSTPITITSSEEVFKDKDGPTCRSFAFSGSSSSSVGDKSFRFPKRNRVLSHESRTFLDRFRSQASSKSLNYSPSRTLNNSLSSSTSTINAYPTNNINTTNGRAGRASTINRNSTASTSPTAEFDSHFQGKPRKWYSFTNLLSRHNLANILSYPRSRLSVSSTLNSVFIGQSSSAETPTPNEDYHPGSFFGGAFNFYQHQQQSTHQQQQNKEENHRVSSSPTPSCITISGEFPTHSNSIGSVGLGTKELLVEDSFLPQLQQQSDSSNYLKENGDNGMYYYRQRGSDRDSGIGDFCNSNNSRASTSPFQDNSFTGFHFTPDSSRPSSSATKRISRLSCGEFFPNSFNFNPLDLTEEAQTTETDFRSSCHPSRTKGTCLRKTLGGSLPTLLQAMESANNGQTSANTGSKPVTTQDVFDLLYQEFAILTGAKSLDDHYIMIFPDRGNFHLLADDDYRRLMIYLTSVPPMQESESGFVLVVDRRNDKWNSVKSTLLRISSYFPGLIHRVFVLRPMGFLQKALSEVSSKLFRTENLRFHLTVCNNVSDLYICIDSNQLTEDFGGIIHYDKIKWVQQRIEVEAFGLALQVLSKDLKYFTDSFRDLEYPNDVGSTERLIQVKASECNRLMDELVLASDHGENLLQRIKAVRNSSHASCIDSSSDPRGSSHNAIASTTATTSVQLVNVISVERFILQIEDTSRLFQEFWTKEKTALERCLKLRRFEQDFKELQGAFDLNVKALNGISDMGDNVAATDALIAETQHFQHTTADDVNHAMELEIVGRVIVSNNPSAVDTVEPKCIELKRMASHFRFILDEKIQTQIEWRQIQFTIEKANQLCTEGMDLISSQQPSDNPDECVDSGVLVKKIDAFLKIVKNISDELSTAKSSLGSASTNQSRSLLKQVHKRVEDLQAMLSKKRASIIQHLSKAKLRRNSGSSTTSGSGSTSSGLTVQSNSELKSAKSTSQLEETGKIEIPVENHILKTASSTLSLDGNPLTTTNNPLGNGNGNVKEHTLENKRIKRGHVLKELLHTENSYVNEIGDILNGYREGSRNAEMIKLLPKQLQQFGKSGHETQSTNMNVLFANLDEIYSFHSQKFLPDLSNCIQSVELVGLCFIQRNLDFLTMYSRYCQLLPASEALRKEIGENHPWFVACRQRLNHKLPLGAYLLKPVQRITKYQLILKDLLKHSEGCEGHSVLVDALDHMLVVLRCVDDGMLQLCIIGYPNRLQDQGPLLLQGSFMLWTETKKDRLRLKGHQRHLFLYQKSILICKKDKDPKSTALYFKTKIDLSEVGLTEVLRGSGSSKKFEIWIQGRLKVFILQAESPDSKEMWVQSIKKLLMEQLESLRVTKSVGGAGVSASLASKRHKMMCHNKGVTINGWRTPSAGHRPLRQTSSWVASDSRPRSRGCGEGDVEDDGSSDVSNSEDDETFPLELSCGDNSSGVSVATSAPPLFARSNSQANCMYGNGESIENSPKYIALADYSAMGSAEISFKEGEILILRKTGCAGWWFVSSTGCEPCEGWAPSAFLERVESSNVTPITVSSCSDYVGTNSKSSLPSQSAHLNNSSSTFQNDNQGTDDIISAFR